MRARGGGHSHSLAPGWPQLGEGLGGGGGPQYLGSGGSRHPAPSLGGCRSAGGTRPGRTARPPPTRRTVLTSPSDPGPRSWTPSIPMGPAPSVVCGHGPPQSQPPSAPPPQLCQGPMSCPRTHLTLALLTRVLGGCEGLPICKVLALEVAAWGWGGARRGVREGENRPPSPGGSLSPFPLSAPLWSHLGTGGNCRPLGQGGGRRLAGMASSGTALTRPGGQAGGGASGLLWGLHASTQLCPTPHQPAQPLPPSPVGNYPTPHPQPERCA